MKFVFICVAFFAFCQISHQYVNLALGKHASISSRAHFWSRPELANDGDGGQVDTKCTQTVGNDTEAWWQVDLQGASILSVQITYAENSADTMAGFSVYVSDNSTHFRNGHLCFHHNALSLPALILEFQCRVHGRYFTFYNERRQDVKYPEAYSTYAIVELCEVEILGCERDEGGFTCLPCSTSCKDEACDIETSECLQCYDGYRGPDCTLECQNSTYGSNCSGRCGHCANDLTCEHVNGTCADGCQTGWLEPFCNSTCPVGYYGSTCDNPCSDRCRSPGQCDSVTGYCVGGCMDGWLGNLCTQQTNPSAVAVEEDTYTTEIVVGVIVGVLVLVIAIVVIVVFIRYIQRSDSRIIAHQKK